MRSILVHADDSPTGENRLQTGLDIARAFGGHVTAHVNTPIVRLFAMDPFGGVYPMAGAIAAAEVDAGALVSRMEARLAQDDVPFTVERSEVEPADALSKSARLADLVVMDLDSIAKFARPQSSLVGAVALSANAPVLALVPGKPIALDGAVMIAWNESRESAAAVRAAVPLLKRAKSVAVVRIGKTEDELLAGPVLDYLSRHDVHAELRTAKDDLHTVEEALEREAEAMRADWIVMGAYGHSRMRETLLGGVTRYLLDSARFPLFLAH
jgi:nucleotide-binding universal stress UspA family protein